MSVKKCWSTKDNLTFHELIRAAPLKYSMYFLAGINIK